MSALSTGSATPGRTLVPWPFLPVFGLTERETERPNTVVLVELHVLAWMPVAYF